MKGRRHLAAEDLEAGAAAVVAEVVLVEAVVVAEAVADEEVLAVVLVAVEEGILEAPVAAAEEVMVLLGNTDHAELDR